MTTAAHWAAAESGSASFVRRILHGIPPLRGVRFWPEPTNSAGSDRQGAHSRTFSMVDPAENTSDIKTYVCRPSDLLSAKPRPCSPMRGCRIPKGLCHSNTMAEVANAGTLRSARCTRSRWPAGRVFMSRESFENLSRPLSGRAASLACTAAVLDRHLVFQDPKELVESRASRTLPATSSAIGTALLSEAGLPVTSPCRGLPP